MERIAGKMVRNHWRGQPNCATRGESCGNAGHRRWQVPTHGGKVTSVSDECGQQDGSGQKSKTFVIAVEPRTKRRESYRIGGVGIATKQEQKVKEA